MTTLNLKSFIPYLVNMPGAVMTPEDRLDECSSHDPHGTQWSSMGLVEALPGEGYLVDLQGSGKLMMVQINDRILPGKVRDELLAKEVERLERLQGRKVSKKEYAQLRDEASATLLPKAFIRRTQIPVIFTRLPYFNSEAMLICTGSQKKADEVATFLLAVFGAAFSPWKILPKHPLDGTLTTLVKTGDFEIDDHGFEPHMSVVLKGANKKTIRIKDKSLGDKDIDALWAQDYTVSEIGLTRSAGEFDDTFTVTDSLIFKSCRMAGFYVPPRKNSEAGDWYGHAVGLTLAYRRLLSDFLQAVGGIVDRPSTSVATAPFIDPDL